MRPPARCRPARASRCRPVGRRRLVVRRLRPGAATLGPAPPPGPPTRRARPPAVAARDRPPGLSPPGRPAVREALLRPVPPELDPLALPVGARVRRPGPTRGVPPVRRSGRRPTRWKRAPARAAKRSGPRLNRAVRRFLRLRRVVPTVRRPSPAGLLCRPPPTLVGRSRRPATRVGRRSRRAGRGAGDPAGRERRSGSSGCHRGRSGRRRRPSRPGRSPPIPRNAGHRRSVPASR